MDFRFFFFLVYRKRFKLYYECIKFRAVAIYYLFFFTYKFTHVNVIGIFLGRFTIKYIVFNK